MKNYENVLKELNNESLKSDVIETTTLFVDTLCGNVISVGKLIKKITDTILNYRDKILMRNFLEYIFSVDKSLEHGVNLLVKLFPEDEKGRKNAEKIVLILDRIDNEDKIKYIANATASCIYGRISVSDFFRIVKIIDNSYFYDLVFLSENITKKTTFKGNITIHALTNLGLMIQCGIDCNEDIEKQDYAFTELGFLVDRYALSYDNEERQKFYTNYYSATKFKLENVIEPISSADIKKLFDEDK